MIMKLLPVVLALVGLGAGVGAGIAFRPEPEPPEKMGEDVATMADKEMPDEMSETSLTDPSNYDFVRLNNQFVIPIVSDERVTSLVVVSLTIQVKSGESETVYEVEPKLRDTLLQVMFNHANIGGFAGNFTRSARMDTLRNSLRLASKKVLGDILTDVLITDVVRQDA